MPRRPYVRALVAATALAAGSALAVTIAPAAVAAGPDRLDKHDRALLAAARDRGDQRVEVMLATTRGAAASAASRLRSLGGTVRYTSTSVGYVRAMMPLDKVKEAVGGAEVVTADLGETFQRVEPSAEPGSSTSAAAAPNASTPDDNPYMPTGETGAVDFKKTVGRDGRGVTIGILDSGIDLGHPALQNTTTGETKIVDWVSATDPLADGDLTWFDLSAASRQVQGPSFNLTGSGVTKGFKAPAGKYRARMRLESVYGDLYGGDLNRDGDTDDAVAVLWDESAGTVRVDSDMDQDFTNNPPMKDFTSSRQSGSLGVDNPATELRESVPFVVQIAKQDKAVNLGIVTDSHGSHVAGITAANGMFGGEMDGQAPGAKLVSVQVCLVGGGCTNHGLVEGMIYAVETAKVDVVNMSIGGLPALNDGNNVRAEVYNRLIRDNGVQIVISAGNSGPGINTVGDPSVATDVISVAAGISKETWKANYNADVSADQALFNFSSRGPREDGGLKPTISAPGAAVSTIPTWQEGEPVAGTFELPPGYGMFNGTSMSSPQTAGALALVIGAAKRDAVVRTPASLRAALTSTAVFNSEYGVHEQGWGRIDVPKTYALLKKMTPTAVRKPLPTSEFSVVAGVCTEISPYLARPDKGIGVYNRCAADRGGQAAGATRSYPISVTRSTGTKTSFAVKLVGDGAGVFGGVPASISLTQGKASTFNLTATAASSGVYSVLVVLDDPATPYADLGIPATVVVSDPINAAGGFAQSTAGTVERNRAQRVFVTVPVGAPYLQVSLGGYADGSQVRFIANDPYGLPVEQTSSLVCYTNRDPLEGYDCDPAQRTYANPLPGVWELTVEARRTTPVLANPYTLSASVVGVTVDPAAQTVISAASATTTLGWTLTNAYGAVTVGAAGGDLGSALRGRKSIGHEETQLFDVEVPAGATSLRAVIGSTSDLGADLDLTVYDEDGAVVGSSADGDSEEAVTVDDPTAGTYTVEVYGYDVPAGTTAYDYLDVFVSPTLGTLSAAESVAPRSAGETWAVSGSVTPLASPGPGRLLLGQLLARTATGAVIGTGDVLVNVTP